VTETTATYASERVRDCVRRASGLVQTRDEEMSPAHDRSSLAAYWRPEALRIPRHHRVAWMVAQQFRTSPKDRL